MTTADWALVVSILSLAVSLAGFVWTVWSKFIYPKPRVEISFTINKLYPDPTNVGNFLSLSGTNHGPGKVVLQSAVVRMHTTQHGSNFGLLSPWDNFPIQPGTGKGPFGGGLPKELDVGERFAVYFPFSGDGFLADHVKYVGFQDSFNKIHWASARAVKAVNKTYEETFGPIGAAQFARSENGTETP